MADSPLPLKAFFDQLRAKGFALGVEEYELLLRALATGDPPSDEDGLKSLCRTLWYKPDQSRELFDELFDTLWRRETDARSSRLAALRSAPSQPDPPPREEDSPPETDRPAREIPDYPPPGPTEPSAATDEPPLPEPEQVEAATQYWLSLRSSQLDPVDERAKEEEETRRASGFLWQGAYRPIRPRAAQLSWRFLRSGGRHLPTEALDIDATVARYARRGDWIAPVFRTEFVADTRLVVLIDHSPSMAAFAEFAQKMAEITPAEAMAPIPGRLYFQNVPERSLFADRGHQRGFTLRDLRRRFAQRPLRLLIVSDAGAARGYRNPARIAATYSALRALESFASQLAWLNPVPRHRWAGSSAADIAQRVPMFEASEAGLVRGVNVLRGKIVG